jgi:hypothetical protein
MQLKVNGQDVCSNHVHLTLQLPSKLVFDISGKDYNHDTVVDKANQVVQDKYIKLLDLKIGKVPIQEVHLLKIIHYRTDKDTVIPTNYWGFNGKVIIDINQENFIKYLLMLDNKFELYQ